MPRTAQVLAPIMMLAAVGATHAASHKILV